MSDEANPKDIMGQKKDLISLVPPEGIRGIARAMKYGAREAKRADGGKGYGDYNWRQTKVKLSIYLDAIMRHTMALVEGEKIDKDSGLPHEDHIGANVCIIKDAKKYNCLIDDLEEHYLSSSKNQDIQVIEQTDARMLNQFVEAGLQANWCGGSDGK